MQHLHMAINWALAVSHDDPHIPITVPSYSGLTSCLLATGFQGTQQLYRPANSAQDLTVSIISFCHND
jgi:hypothetical protein